MTGTVAANNQTDVSISVKVLVSREFISYVTQIRKTPRFLQPIFLSPSKEMLFLGVCRSNLRFFIWTLRVNVSAYRIILTRTSCGRMIAALYTSVAYVVMMRPKRISRTHASVFNSHRHRVVKWGCRRAKSTSQSPVNKACKKAQGHLTLEKLMDFNRPGLQQQ